MANTTVMASTCLIGQFVEGKTTPNTNLVHTPPPTGNLPTFFGALPNAGKITR